MKTTALLPEQMKSVWVWGENTWLCCLKRVDIVGNKWGKPTVCKSDNMVLVGVNGGPDRSLMERLWKWELYRNAEIISLYILDWLENYTRLVHVKRARYKAKAKGDLGIGCDFAYIFQATQNSIDRRENHMGIGHLSSISAHIIGLPLSCAHERKTSRKIV